MLAVQSFCPLVLYDVPAPNLHQYTWTSPDGKTDLLVDRRWHSSILDVQSFKGADCDTDNYLVIWRG
jgi:hypothetical protein